MLSFRHKAGLSLYRGCGYGLQSLIPDCDTHVSRKLQYFAFSEYNIYLCLVGLQSQNSSLNLCQLKRRKRGTTAWDTQLLLREWIHSCLYDIQRGIGSRWDHEWQNLQHSRIIDITVLATSPEWDISVLHKGECTAGTGRGCGLRPQRNALSLFFCTLEILWPNLEEGVYMHVNVIEKKQSSPLNNRSKSLGNWIKLSQYWDLGELSQHVND